MMQAEPSLGKDQPAPSARKTRTLYVREEDQETWDQARELIGDSLSTYITNHLRSLVASKRAAQEGYERIVLQYTDQIPQAKAFYGHWVIPPADPYETAYEEGHDYYAVALTSKGKVVVFNFWGVSYNGADYQPGKFHVFESLGHAAATSATPDCLIAEVMKRQGVEVQELDI